MYFCILLALSLTIILIQLWDCGQLHMQLDAPSLILLLLLFFATMIATKATKKLAMGFYYVFREKDNVPKEKEVSLPQYRECLEAVRFSMRTLLLSGYMITLLNLHLFSYSDDKISMIASFQVSLSGILYGLLGCFLLLPVCYRLKKKIMHYVPDEIEAEESLEDRSEKAYFKLRGMGLTTREAEVGRLILCQKMSNKEIADELFISESTVKRHVTHILEKLEITSREEIAVRIKNEQIGGNLSETDGNNPASTGDNEKLLGEKGIK